MPYQYGNEANPRAHYETTGPEILRDVPDIDVFVAGLGHGRHADRHRALPEGAQAGREGRRVRAAPGRSGAGTAQPRRRLHPAGARRVAARRQDRRRLARVVCRREGADPGGRHLRGHLGGAALRTAQRVAERLDTGNIVILLADGGWKYLSTSLWSRDYDEMESEIEGKVWW